ncbi:nuclear transport factor 2 family protein [Nocardia sp. NBC_01503]|uniref:nuclear transport factor 2 family protein n=1 Tax=Nocardia sp. NBC_01503 TaxID=2975997 RepID=UPI002E7AB4AD|nr:nuclear transport factor 2 family protein [Nocardia sp. NBC_01503]WTL30690.1 nuclear transport factor 2 family protein [Nocardia sp. NBC_01503]
MSTMSTPDGFDAEALRRGIEGRDAQVLLSLYADDAEIRMVDHRTQPSHPRVMHGRSAISEMLTDVYGREMTHTLESVVVDGDHLAFLESCRYPDGVRVLCSSVADLRDGRIIDQTSIQAWDE